jgi:hypothetical protein
VNGSTTPAELAAADGVMLAVEAQDDVAIDRVEFFDGDTAIGTVSASPYELEWIVSEPAANGDHPLRAQVYDTSENSAESEIVHLSTDLPPGGTPVWTQSIDGGAGLMDQAWGVAVDGDRNVFVSGRVILQGDTSNDAWLLKLTPDGDHDWERTHNGPGDNSDIFQAVAIDGDGNVVVTGREWTGSDDQNDLIVRKYSSGGDVQWTRRFTGPDGYDDGGTRVSVGPQGDILVGGDTDIPGSWTDVWLRRYTPHGDTVWTDSFDGGDDDFDSMSGVAFGAEGQTYAAFDMRTPDGRQLWIREYDAEGQVAWNAEVSEDSPIAMDLAVTPSGDLVVSGSAYDESLELHGWIGRYGPDGTEQWTTTWETNLGTLSYATAVAVDHRGSIVVGGELRVSDNPIDHDFWYGKFSPTGELIWDEVVASQGTWDEINDVAVDRFGYVLLVGTDSTAATMDDVWIRAAHP